MSLRTDQKGLLLGVLLTAAVWTVPYGWVVLYPLTLLATHLHELSHAVAVMASGGEVLQIRVFADGSGVTPFRGGSVLVAASAGYIGTSVLGGLFIVLGSWAKGARVAAWGLGVSLALSMLLFVRGDAVGLAFGALWGLVALAAAVRASGERLRWPVQFLGLALCASSFRSFMDLVQLSLGSGVETDASIMASRSGIPAVLWAVGWAVVAVVAVWAGLARVWRSGKSG